MVLSTLTLVGLMVIQSIAPLTINRSASASDTEARSAEVVRSEELIPADEMSADEILRAELNKGEISGGGSMALPRQAPSPS